MGHTIYGLFQLFLSHYNKSGRSEMHSGKCKSSGTINWTEVNEKYEKKENFIDRYERIVQKKFSKITK